MSDDRNVGLMIAVRAIVCILVIAIGASVMIALSASVDIKAPTVSNIAHQRVVVVKVEQVDVRRQWLGYGTAQAMDVADVPARVTATVESIEPSLQAGKVVSPADTLVTLDESDFAKQETTARQKLTELNAQLQLLKVEESKIAKRRALATEDVTLSREEYVKIEKFYKRGASEKRELDAARRTVIIAELLAIQVEESSEKIEIRRSQINAQIAAQTAQYELAQLNKKRCLIHSPIDGVIESVDVDNGESVSAGQRVVRVISLERIEVSLQLPAAARGDITVGSKVMLEATNESQLSWSSTVKRVSPIDDASTRTFTVFVEVLQPNALLDFGAASGQGLLLPGMFVQGRASSQTIQPRWVVPRRAIRNGRILTIDENGKIQSKKVTIDFVREGKLPQFGLPDDQWAVLANEGGSNGTADSQSAMTSGQLVLVNGSTTARDGQIVDPVFSDKKPAQLPGGSTQSRAGIGNDSSPDASPSDNAEVTP